MLEDSSPSLAKAMESAPSSAIDGSYKAKLQKIKGGSNEVCNNKKDLKENFPTVSITNSTRENNQVPTFEKNSEKNGTVTLEKETVEKIPSESKLEKNTLEKQNNQKQSKKKIKRFSRNKFIGKKKLRNKSSNGRKRKSFRMSKNKKKKVSENENNTNIYKYDDREPKNVYENLYGEREEEKIEDKKENIEEKKQENNVENIKVKKDDKSNDKLEQKDVDKNEVKFEEKKEEKLEEKKEEKVKEENEPNEDNYSQNNIFGDYQEPFPNQNGEIDNYDEILKEEDLNYNYNHEPNGDALGEEGQNVSINIPINTIKIPYDSTND